MRVVVFCHSLVSDWNHGNAHFLRGITAELLARGHTVEVYEPLDGWSRSNLAAEHGHAAIDDIHDSFPWLRSEVYDHRRPRLAEKVEAADLVLVHEWNEPHVVAELGRLRAAGGGFHLLFHDTHHRAVTAPEAMARYDLSGYDGVLAFGRVLRDLYLERGWAARAWTWHEAADVRTFHPLPGALRQQDLVWIGNWGDGERTRELHEMLLGPVARLGLRASVHGVRYPAEALAALEAAGISYGGWLANHRAPAAFAASAVTVHVPRRPYVEALPGIPTIRPFEALACGIPLVSAPWEDAEQLFSAGHDHLIARNGEEMQQRLRDVLHDGELRSSLVANGLRTITERHTCGHRVEELLGVCRELGATTTTTTGATHG